MDRIHSLCKLTASSPKKISKLGEIADLVLSEVAKGEHLREA